MKITFEWDKLCKYGAPVWVIIKVDDKEVARVDWINGPPYLSAIDLTTQKEKND